MKIRINLKIKIDILVTRLRENGYKVLYNDGDYIVSLEGRSNLLFSGIFHSISSNGGWKKITLLPNPDNIKFEFDLNMFPTLLFALIASSMVVILRFMLNIGDFGTFNVLLFFFLITLFISFIIHIIYFAYLVLTIKRLGN